MPLGFVVYGFHATRPLTLPSPPLGERVAVGRVRGKLWFIVPMPLKKSRVSISSSFSYRIKFCSFQIANLSYSHPDEPVPQWPLVAEQRCALAVRGTLFPSGRMNQE